MILLRYTEVALAAMLVLFIVTQVVLPGFLGRPLFPIFRRQVRTVLRQEAEANLKSDIRDLREHMRNKDA